MERYRQELLQDFKQLVSFDSVSFRERKTADFLAERLKKMGFTVTEDTAAEYYGGNAGNIYAVRKGRLPGSPILFSAHMDVVEPGTGKTAVLAGDMLCSDGKTVLGADDINGILEILYGIQAVLDQGEDHRDIEVLFTIGEEMYGKGEKIFDYSRIKAREAYVLDMSGGIGKAAYKAPSIISFTLEITGRSAHAGFCPENGIHAICVAAEIIRKLPRGRVGSDTTFNIGTIQGGTLTNIVPEKTVCRGEIRSYDHEKALRLCEDIVRQATTTAQKYGAAVSFTKEVHIRAYETALTSRCVGHFREAAKKLSLVPELNETFGESDNNVFAEHGIEGIVLSCGMHDVHSVAEYTTVRELMDGARLVCELTKCK